MQISKHATSNNAGVPDHQKSTRITSLVKLGLIALAVPPARAISVTDSHHSESMRRLKLLDFDYDFSMPLTGRAYCTAPEDAAQTPECVFLVKSPSAVVDFDRAKRSFSDRNIHTHYNSANGFYYSNTYNNQFDYSSGWPDDDFYGDRYHHSQGSVPHLEHYTCDAFASSPRKIMVINYDSMRDRGRPTLTTLNVWPDVADDYPRKLSGISHDGRLLQEQDMGRYCSGLMREEDDYIYQTQSQDSSRSLAYQACERGKDYFYHRGGRSPGAFLPDRNNQLVGFAMPGTVVEDFEHRLCLESPQGGTNSPYASVYGGYSDRNGYNTNVNYNTNYNVNYNTNYNTNHNTNYNTNYQTNNYDATSQAGTDDGCRRFSCSASAWSKPMIAVVKDSKIVYGGFLKRRGTDYVVSEQGERPIRDFCARQPAASNVDADQRPQLRGNINATSASAPRLTNNIKDMCQTVARHDESVHILVKDILTLIGIVATVTLAGFAVVRLVESARSGSRNGQGRTDERLGERRDEPDTFMNNSKIQCDASALSPGFVHHAGDIIVDAKGFAHEYTALMGRKEGWGRYT